MSRFSTFARMALVPAIALVCAVALPGCGSKVTQDNFAQIKPGTPEADVQKILGAPTSTEDQKGPMGTAANKVWKDGDKSITVLFVDGKVFDAEKTGF